VKALSVVSALIIFGAWMSVVGNPHVVETVIGLILALGGGIWVYRISRNAHARWQKFRSR